MRIGNRLAALLVTAAVVGCNRGEATEEAAPVMTSTVTRGNLRISADAVGSIEPVRRVEVKSKASGEILRLYVDVGDVVQQGALLAEVDPRDVKNRYDQAVADLEVSQAQADNARAQLGRTEELHKAGVITDQELESSRLQATNSAASLTRAKTNLDLAQLQLNDVVIRAPMSGTILQKNVEEGTVIQSAAQNVSGGTALFVMASLDQMQVRTLVDETDIGRLLPGLPTTVSVQAYENRRFSGSVQQIEPQAVTQQNVTKFPVIITLDNPEGLLKPGMNAEVEVLIDEVIDALLVDNIAIVAPDDARSAALALGLDVTKIDFANLPQGPGGTAPGAPAAGGPDSAAAAGNGAPAAAGEAARTNGGGAATPPEGAGRAGQAREGAAAAGGAPGGGQAGGRRGAGGFAGGQGGRAGGGGNFQGARGGGGGRAGGGRTGAPQRQRTVQPAVVFVYNAAGTPEPRMIQIGLGDFDRTQVVSGLEEGDTLAIPGAAQLQAQQTAAQGRGGLGIFGGAVPGGGRAFGGGGPGGGAGGGGGGGGGGRGGD